MSEDARDSWPSAEEDADDVFRAWAPLTDLKRRRFALDGEPISGAELAHELDGFDDVLEHVGQIAIGQTADFDLGAHGTIQITRVA